MDKNCGIYIIMNLVNGKFYIGSSCNIKNRWASHRTTLKTNTHLSKYLQRAYNKYGIENFRYEIVEICSIENLLNREQYWIDFHKTYIPKNGYNISPTAGNTNGYKHTDGDKYKMKLIMKERISKMSKQEKKDTFGKGRKSKPISKEHLIKLRDGWKKADVPNNKIRIEACKISNTLLKSKPVLQYDKNGNFLNEFRSAKFASEILNLGKFAAGRICAVCKGHKYRNTAYGFIWKYKNNINI